MATPGSQPGRSEAEPSPASNPTRPAYRDDADLAVLVDSFPRGTSPDLDEPVVPEIDRVPPELPSGPGPSRVEDDEDGDDDSNSSPMEIESDPNNAPVLEEVLENPNQNQNDVVEDRIQAGGINEENGPGNHGNGPAGTFGSAPETMNNSKRYKVKS